MTTPKDKKVLNLAFKYYAPVLDDLNSEFLKRYFAAPWNQPITEDLLKSFTQNRMTDEEAVDFMNFRFALINYAPSVNTGQ